MKIFVYSHEVSNSIRVVYDYYPKLEDGTKIHKERTLWVRYIQ